MTVNQPLLLAASIAAFLTYCDLDTVFDAPPALSRAPRYRLMALWWGFILINFMLAGLLYYALDESGYFQSTNRWLAALGAGASYSALIRLKFTTLSIRGEETPIGIDTFYEGLKSLIHKRINRIIRDWRMEESQKLARSDLATLRQRCRMQVLGDSLMSEEQQRAANTWIEQVATGPGIEDTDRLVVLAMFILTGQRKSIS